MTPKPEQERELRECFDDTISEVFSEFIVYSAIDSDDHNALRVELSKRLAETLRRYLEKSRASDWVSVETRLPEKEDYYYVTDIDPKTGERYVEYTYYFADAGFDSYNPQAWLDWYPAPYTPPAVDSSTKGEDGGE